MMGLYFWLSVEALYQCLCLRVPGYRAERGRAVFAELHLLDTYEETKME